MRVLISSVEVGKGSGEVLKHVSQHLSNKGIVWEWVAFNPTLHHPSNFTTRLYQFFRACGRCDVAICLSFPSWFFATLFGIPTIYYCLEPQFALTPDRLISKVMVFLEKKMIRKTLPVVNNAAEAGRFRAIYGISPIILPYGIDTEFWGAKRLEWMPFDDYPVIFHVGEVQPFKNQEDTLCVVKELQRDGINVHVHFYGKIHKQYKKRLDEIIRNLEIKNVVFCGDVDREDLRRQYTMCNVLIHPIKMQGGVLAPYEAICAGVPVVTSPDFSEWANIAISGLGYVNMDGVILNYSSLIADIIARRKPNPSNKRAYDWIKANKSWERFCEQILYYCNGIKR